MQRGLRKTRESLVEGVATLLVGRKEIDDELLDELESQLLQADLGIEVTTRVMKAVSQKLGYGQPRRCQCPVHGCSGMNWKPILTPLDTPFVPATDSGPCVILVVGVNGVGKTNDHSKDGQAAFSARVSG